MSWTRAILVQWGTLSLDDSSGGANMVMIDMRYMWSEMDSPLIPKRRQPSRFVVLRRSRRWKNGIGVFVFSSGGCGRVDNTAEVSRNLEETDRSNQPVFGVHDGVLEPMAARTEENEREGRRRAEGKRNMHKAARDSLIRGANNANTRYRVLTAHCKTQGFPLSGLAASMAASRLAAKVDWATPSPLAVFVRNLKLLHLDRREDWPGVTVRSLSPSPQNQRQRIRLVEWALYYLFTIWDPEIAQNVFSLIFKVKRAFC